MKVLIMPSWYKGINSEEFPVGVFHYEEAVELKKEADVALFYLFDKTMKANFYEGMEEGVRVFRTKYISGEKLHNWLRVFFMFRKIVKSFQPDIIHAHVASEVGRYAIVLGKFFRIPVVITEHSAPEYAGMSDGFGKKLGHWIYSNSKYNVCVSETLQDNLSSLYPDIKFGMIYTGVKEPQRIENSFLIKRKADGVINIAIVALLYSKDIKGLQYLIPAMAKLKEEGYRIALHVVGGGNYYDYFKTMAEKLGIGNNCIFYGFRTKLEVFEIISEMDFVISTSLVETFGCTLAEAMMMGKPVLATKSGGPNYYINDRVGKLIEKGSIESIVLGIKKMIENLENYDKEYIQNYAIETFSLSSINKKYLEIFSRFI